jgi:hypothetical protein
MTLRQQTHAALEALGLFHDGSHALDVTAGPLRLTCHLTVLEKLGCQFDHLAVHSPALAGATPDRLRQVAAALAGRITYLLEAISPIELDREECVVQLRSSPPQRDDDGATYYELLARRGGEISLRRYRKASGDQRHTIPAQLTREALLRLVDDFAATLC